MNRSRPSGLFFATTYVVLIVAIGSGAHAQQLRDSTSDQLEEVVVTAAKRSSTVQETPISITAITGAEILERGFADFTELAQSVPGMSMKTSGPGQTEFELRGITSAGGNSPTVGFYLDDVPLTAPAAAINGKVVIDPNLYDLNRVEVLRGPQGTLYGSGSMGGTIKLVPNAPNPAAFDASAQTIFSDTDGGGFNHGENAMVNLPLGNSAALRIVGSQSYQSGWIDRIVVADGAFPLETNGNKTRGNVLAAPVAEDFKNVNDERFTAVRASLLWKPTDELSITPTVMYQRTTQNGLGEIDSNPGTNAHYEPFNAPEPFSDRFTLGSLNFQYAFDAFDLTSTTSKWVRDEDINQDGAESFQWIFSTPTSPFPLYTSQGGVGAYTPTPWEDDKSNQTSEELRLTSSGNSNFKWLAGYFYSDFESEWNQTVLAPGAVPLFGSANGFTQIQPTKIVQNSFFGEISYQLTQQLKATAGMRRYSYNSGVHDTVSGFLSITGSDTVGNFATEEHDQGVDPKFDLSYQVDKDLLLYVNAAKGFRPGGGNQPVPTSGPLGAPCEADLQASHGTTSFVAAPLSFGPDSVWSYELGEKATAFDNRVSVDSSIYIETWNGVQQTIPLSCGFLYTNNAGDAHIYGTELELNAILVSGLSLSVSAAYIHATFVVGSVEAGVIAGTRVQDVPNATSSVALAYRHSISNDLEFTSRIQNNYVGTRTDATYSINDLPSYDLTNIRADVNSGERWTAALFANNVFNKRALLTDTSSVNVNLPTYNRIAVSQPLTVGVDLSYHFGR